MIIGLDASRGNREIKSGVEWYSHHIIRNLYKIDFRNQYWLYTDKELNQDLKPSRPNFEEKLLNWPLKRFWTLGRMSLEMVFKKPDVLFIPSHTFPLVGGKKNVITWHDIGYERYPETYTAWELASLKGGARRAFKMADRIITISNFTKNEMMERHNLDSEKIRVIYLGCNHQRWQPIEPEALKEFLRRKNITLPYFIYVGRMALRKNLIGLIRVYNLFREKVRRPHNLILVGSPAPLQEEIDDEIMASPFKNEIKKLGWVEMNDLPALVGGAQALVYPSIFEGFGLPAIEAMACGVPVIASTSGSLPEVVGDAGILKDAHDVEGLAEAMQQVTEDGNLRRELIAKGLARAREFSWEKCARETLEVLENIKP